MISLLEANGIDLSSLEDLPIVGDIIGFDSTAERITLQSE